MGVAISTGEPTEGRRPHGHAPRSPPSFARNRGGAAVRGEDLIRRLTQRSDVVRARIGIGSACTWSPEPRTTGRNEPARGACIAPPSTGSSRGARDEKGADCLVPCASRSVRCAGLGCPRDAATPPIGRGTVYRPRDGRALFPGVPRPATSASVIASQRQRILRATMPRCRGASPPTPPPKKHKGGQEIGECFSQKKQPPEL